jgi:hypothetical protein
LSDFDKLVKNLIPPNFAIPANPGSRSGTGAKTRFQGGLNPGLRRGDACGDFFFREYQNRRFETSSVKLSRQEPGASLGYKLKLLEPSELPLHLQTEVWSFMRLNKGTDSDR